VKPASFKKSLWMSVSKTLAAFLLVIVFAACGTSTVISSPVPSRPGSATSTSANTPPSASLTVNAASISIRVGNLLIQSGGFECPDGYLVNGFFADRLVLASDRTTYNQDEITQMRSYVLGLTTVGMGRGPVEVPTVKPPLPPLRWVLGGYEDTGYNAGCGETLKLTNTGNASIQIPALSIQLEAHSQPNMYHYRLIDACSFILPSEEACIPTGSAGGGQCGEYSVFIQLEPGEKNRLFSVQLIQPGCSTLTIPPDTQIPLNISFGSPSNLVYSILPILTINTGQGGEQRVSLTRLSSTLAFAQADQLSCYQLHGTAFVLLPSINPSPGWCM
jgi:hypothetical protein